MDNSTAKKKAHLPVSRINTIMKSSSDVDTVDKESSLLMCKATELFIGMLAIEGYQKANQAKKLDYKHLAEVVHVEEKYNFLRDIMPKKLTVLEYKNIMAKKNALENEGKKEDGSSSDSSDDEEDSSSGSDESSASA